MCDALFEMGGKSHFVGASVIVGVSSGWLEMYFSGTIVF